MPIIYKSKKSKGASSEYLEISFLNNDNKKIDIFRIPIPHESTHNPLKLNTAAATKPPRQLPTSN